MDLTYVVVMVDYEGHIKVLAPKGASRRGAVQTLSILSTEMYDKLVNTQYDDDDEWVYHCAEHIDAYRLSVRNEIELINWIMRVNTVWCNIKICAIEEV